MIYFGCWTCRVPCVERLKTRDGCTRASDAQVFPDAVGVSRVYGLCSLFSST